MTPGRAAFVAAVFVTLLAATLLIVCWLVCRALASPEPAETPMPAPVCRDCNEYIRPAGEDDEEEWVHSDTGRRWGYVAWDDPVPHRAEPLGGEGL